MFNMKLLPTAVPDLDAVLNGGVPAYSLNIVAGQPGTGKTILAQQMLFGHIRDDEGAAGLYLTTLSEPTLKVVRYMQHFAFFDAEAFGERVIYRDLGSIVRERSLPEVTDYILNLVETHRPGILVIDSFKAIKDLARETGEFRSFCYDLSVRLASARCTTFLAGEYNRADIAQGAEFAVADGILYLDIAQQQGEKRRFLQVLKLRGQATEMAPFPFVISDEGVRILSPALTLERRKEGLEVEAERARVGVSGLDGLLRGGIPRGRPIILSGISGTGKTTLALQFLIRGAEQGEKGMIFSFEESPDRLRGTAEGFGWKLAEWEEKGLIRVVFIPQTSIRVEENLEQMIREMEVYQPRRFVVDSFSVFLYKMDKPADQREKSFQLATLVQRAGAIGVLISDIPAEEPNRLSRFGVEETVMDGTIVLSSVMDRLRRRRYIEVYKMRASDHVPGRHRMEIAERGIEVFYAATQHPAKAETPPPLIFEPMQGIIFGGSPYGSSWLVRGDPGMGKSTLSYQFAIEGLRRREAVLYIAADAPGSQVTQAMQGFGFLAAPYIESGQLALLDAFGQGAGHLDLSDPEAFLFTVTHQAEQMIGPLRVILDSLTPMALDYTPDEFVGLVHRKNRLLRRPGVTVFDAMLQRTLDESKVYSLLNAFDIVVDLYTPDWGEMGFSGHTGQRALRVHKARVAGADTRPFPYTISPTEGVVVQKDYYKRQTGGRSGE
jgi:circadian clock protein KaiC